MNLSNFKKYAAEQRKADKASNAPPLTEEYEAPPAINIPPAQEDTQPVPVYELPQEVSLLSEQSAPLFPVPDVRDAVEQENPSEAVPQNQADTTTEIHTAEQEAEETDRNGVFPATEYLTTALEEYIGNYFPPKSVKIELTRLIERRDNIFCPPDEQDFDILRMSVDSMGITEPLLVRTKGDGDYEIISGNRRKSVAEQLGWIKVPCRVADKRLLTEALAKEITVLCNLHRREALRTSELAKCVEILNAIHSEDNKDEIIAEQCGIKPDRVSKYLKINHLIDSLLNALDDNKLPFAAGVVISEIPREKQEIIYRVFSETGFKKLTLSVSEMLRSEAEALDEQRIRSIIENADKPPVSIEIPADIMALFNGKSNEEIAGDIYEAIKLYQTRNKE